MEIKEQFSFPLDDSSNSSEHLHTAIPCALQYKKETLSLIEKIEILKDEIHHNDSKCVICSHQDCQKSLCHTLKQIKEKELEDCETKLAQLVQEVSSRAGKCLIIDGACRTHGAKSVSSQEKSPLQKNSRLTYNAVNKSFKPSSFAILESVKVAMQGLGITLNKEQKHSNDSVDEITKHFEKISITNLQHSPNKELQAAVVKWQFQKKLSGAYPWVANHHNIHALDSKGSNPVFFLGSEPYLSLDEVENVFINVIQEEGMKGCYKKKHVPKELAKVKEVCSALCENASILKYDLVDFIQIVKKCCSLGVEQKVEKQLHKVLEKLQSLIQEHEQYIPHSEIVFLLEEKVKSSNDTLQRLIRELNTYKMYSDFRTIEEKLIASKFKFSTELIEGLSSHCKNVKQYQDIELEKQLAFKIGYEALLERRANYIASLLTLDTITVEGVPVAMTQFNGISKNKYPLKSPIGNVQLYVHNGMLVSEYKKLKNKDPEKFEKIQKCINQQNFQDVCLFSAISKQNDLHEDNAFIVKNDDGTFSFKLFDIGRCLTGDGASQIKRIGSSSPHNSLEIGTFLYFRCFLLGNPKIHEPLTDETIEKIKKWDIASLEKILVQDDEVRQKIDKLQMEMQMNAKILHDENKIEPRILWKTKDLLKNQVVKLDELVSKHYESKSLHALIRRLKSVKALVENATQENRPSLFACMYVANPIEMDFMILYQKVYGIDNAAMVLTTVEDAIEYGLKNSTLSVQEATMWLDKLKNLIDTKQLPLIPQQFGKSLVS